MLDLQAIGVTAEDQADLRELSRHRGWTCLQRLLNKMEEMAQDNLNASSDRDTAWGRLQYLRGTMKLNEIIRQLYSETRNETATVPSRTSIARERINGDPSAKLGLSVPNIVIAGNPADEQPTGASY